MEIDNIYNMDCLEGMKQIPDGTIDASVDTIVKEQDESPVEDMRKALEELAERENVPKVYILKEQYEMIDPEIIHQKEAEFHCVLVPVEEHKMKRIKDDAVPYTMPPDLTELPDIKMPQHAMYDVPHVKGGRYHEPPRNLKKKKKAKRRQQKQSRRKR